MASVAALHAAQAQDSVRTLADLPPSGVVVPLLRSRSNPKATYALYLPHAFSRERQWPVVFLLDPRGRALVPMELFRETAERLGYVLLSSYDSQSDGDRAPNDMALDAMLDDAQRYLNPDTHRFYIAGFSGTARFAWDVSEQLPGALAGILGFGAATPGEGRWLDQHVRGTPFDYYGAVGTLDPNYLEMRQLDRDLTARGFQFRIEGFDGPHRWPPQDVCVRSLEWMHLQAMRRGLVRADSSWIDSLAALRLADILRRAGPTSLLRARLLRVWVQDFAGFRDTTAVARQAVQLAESRDVRKMAQREDEWAARDLGWARGYVDYLLALRTASDPQAVGDGRRASGVDEIVKLAKRANDSLATMTARRAISRILVYATFYEFRGYEQSRRWDRARTLLELAAIVAPEDFGVCYGLARADAQLGHGREALDALECAAKTGQLSREALAAPALDPIRGEERFKAIATTLPSPPGQR